MAPVELFHFSSSSCSSLPVCSDYTLYLSGAHLRVLTMHSVEMDQWANISLIVESLLSSTWRGCKVWMVGKVWKSLIDGNRHLWRLMLQLCYNWWTFSDCFQLRWGLWASGYELFDVYLFDVVVEYCLTLGVHALRLVQMRGLLSDCRPLTLTKLCRGWLFRELEDRLAWPCPEGTGLTRTALKHYRPTWKPQTDPWTLSAGTTFRLT